MTGAAAQAANLRADHHRARAAVIAVRDQLARAQGSLTRVSIALAAAFNGADQGSARPGHRRRGLRTPAPVSPLPVADPALRAVVEGRFNRLTFDQIATEVATNFPPERRVRWPGNHDWWQRAHERKNPDHPG